MTGDENAALWWAALARDQEALRVVCLHLLERDGLSPNSQEQLRLALQALSDVRNAQ